MIALVDEVIRIAQSAQIPFGPGAYDAASTTQAIERGAGFLLTGVQRLLAAAEEGVLRTRAVGREGCDGAT